MLNNYFDYIAEIESIIHSPQNIENMKKTYEMLTKNKVYIYGAGNAGAMTYDILHEVSIDVEAFFDMKANLFTYRNKAIYKADDQAFSAELKKDTVVIIAFICDNNEFKDMEKWLNDLGYMNTCYFHDIYNLFITNKSIRTSGNLLNSHYTYEGSQLLHSDDKIIKVAKLLQDDESRTVYKNFLRAIFSSDSSYFSLPSEQPQYFVSNIPFVKGYSRFMDCGAFDGDTGFVLKKLKGEIESIVFFEPDQHNFNKLCSNIKINRIAKEQILYPCGTWKENDILRFNSGKKSSSGISEKGDVMIQCVAIDDVLGDFAPTFIKMDIEGAEYDALLGAKNSIRSSRPDLAISIYHRVEHMWEIPLLIDSFDIQYKFYIRSHGLHGMETILYAVSSEKGLEG